MKFAVVYCHKPSFLKNALYFKSYLNPLSANPIKGLNTFTQFVGSYLSCLFRKLEAFFASTSTIAGFFIIHFIHWVDCFSNLSVLRLTNLFPSHVVLIASSFNREAMTLPAIRLKISSIPMCLSPRISSRRINPAGNYMFIVNNIVNFEHISHIVLEFSLLTMSRSMPAGKRQDSRASIVFISTNFELSLPIISANTFSKSLLLIPKWFEPKILHQPSASLLDGLDSPFVLIAIFLTISLWIGWNLIGYIFGNGPCNGMPSGAFLLSGCFWTSWDNIQHSKESWLLF